MSLGPAFDAKEQVRQAVDIVDLVSSYVQLRRQGRNYVGVCPWHDDSRPSLTVNPERQSFKCWVCDYGGDVFSFVMRSENLEFREALELLAERAGISLSPPQSSHGEPGGSPARSSDATTEKRTLYRVAAWAENEFHRCLLESPEAEPGRAYFAQRGLTQDTINRFRLGFAPNRWDWILERAHGTEWTLPLLERVGLISPRERGGYVDVFRGRVMFSIRDSRSRPVAFGGRVLPQLAGGEGDYRPAKYINSRETPLFSKSRELYALDVARENFKAEGGVIVMEGYTDALMAHQHGLNNCVAVLGTALGERHLQLLRRYTESITLVLDGDAAGQRRTNEILDALLALFEKNQIDLRILILPGGVDPCDFIATHGSDQFRGALLATAVDALEHKFKVVTNGLDTLTDTHRASQAAEQLLGTLAQLRPAGSGASSTTLLREEQMLSRIARKFHLPEEQLRSRLNAIRREATARPRSQPRTEGDGPSQPPRQPLKIADLVAWDRGVLELIILDPTLIPRVAAAIDPQYFTSAVARRIYVACCRIAEESPEGDFGRLLAAFDEPEMKSLLVQLDESCALKATGDRERWLADLVESHRRSDEEQERRTYLAAARQSADNAEQLLAEFCNLAKTKHQTDYERRKK